MTFATVMAAMALSGSNERLLSAAATLAKAGGGHVIGVSAAEFSAPLYYASGEGAQRIIDERIAEIAARQAALEAEFVGAMAKAGCRAEWRAAIDFPVDYVARQSRAADLVICAGDGDAPTDPSTGVQPADLAMRLGRPLLVLPPEPAPIDLSRTLVAWKDSQEARRAVAAAMPLLRAASAVTLAAIADDIEERDGVRAAAADVAGWLKRHGVEARIVTPDAVGETAAQLQAQARECRAGVIVAGAYGHSRLREWALGGVTQHLLSQRERAVFLMH